VVEKLARQGRKMPPNFQKGDRVKAYATRFDKKEEDLDEGEQLFSAKWAAEGNGIWCHGAVARVYVKKGRRPQEYMIRYDNGESMRGIEEHLEAAEDDGESEVASEEEKDNMDRDSDEGSTDPEIDAGVRAQREDVDREVTDDEAGEIAEGEEAEMGEVTDIGETVTKGTEDDPKKTTWTRIASMLTSARTEEWEPTTFKNLMIRDDTTELDIFLALLHLSPESLLQIVRDGARRAKCTLNWKLEDIFSTFCILFGAGQFKEGTDLWSIQRKGMMPGPDFGLYMSQNRFERMMRYWAYEPEGTNEKLVEKPWEEVDYWVRAFNNDRINKLYIYRIRILYSSNIADGDPALII
jgi:hypothetical protein